jgi:hypothetical protein
MQCRNPLAQPGIGLRPSRGQAIARRPSSRSACAHPGADSLAQRLGEASVIEDADATAFRKLLPLFYPVWFRLCRVVSVKDIIAMA